ncbi:MAG: anti-sigma factor antagonist [Planctomycetota bacterium]
MATIAFKVKVIKSPDGTTATMAEVDGSIDASTIQEFQHVMDKLIERGVKNLVLDCSNIKYINSTGLGTLLKYADTFESIGGHIAFCRVPSKVMLVMEMLGFNALFNIVTDEATALRSFAGKMSPPPSVAVKTTRQAAATSTPAEGIKALPSSATPAVPVSFPLQTPCARCRVTLDVPSSGKFKCPRCNSVLSVEANGRTRFFASKKARPIALTVPANLKLMESAAQVAAICAESLGFKSDAVAAVSKAVAVACQNVIERAYDKDAGNSFHVQIQPDAAALTVKIADYGKPFDFGVGGTIQADSGFAAVNSGMDTVEHRVNPRGGNMITLIKIMH